MNHFRTAIASSIKKVPIDRERRMSQEKRLLLRKRASKTAKPSEDESWAEMYDLNFPGEPLPSPFYDGDLLVDLVSLDAALSERIKATLVANMARTLSHVTRDQLE